MEEPRKRKSPPPDARNRDTNHKKPFRRYNSRVDTQNSLSIEPGDAGIWATCARSKEGKSTIDLRDLFEDYQAKLYPHTSLNDEDAKDIPDAKGEKAEDIEASISAEVSALKSSHNPNPGDQKPLIQSIKIDTQCVLFFKTTPPIDPVAFVQRICQDKATGTPQQGCRFVKRLTPMMRMGKATEEGLKGVSKEVLNEQTMGPRDQGVKYAIRPTLREHNVMKRDGIIEQVAGAVGGGYVVDLKQPDVVILVEVYRNVLGLGVVGGKEFERLKRFNLAEIECKNGDDEAARKGEKPSDGGRRLPEERARWMPGSGVETTAESERRVD